MNADVETDLPNISKIDTDARPGGDPGVRIWFENGAKIQVIEDESGWVERQWFDPNHLGEPEAAETVDDATKPEFSIDEVGFEMVAEYIAFESEDDARENWGDEYVDVLFGR